MPKIANRIPCSTCGKLVYKRPRDMKQSRSGRVYCSPQCFGQGHFERHNCPVCGTEIPLKRKTCSKSCSNKQRAGIEYRKGRPDSKAHKGLWLKYQLGRDRGQQCELCGEPEWVVLVVHHIVERAHGGSDDLTNLQLICDNCHARHHRKDTSQSFDELREMFKNMEGQADLA